MTRGSIARQCVHVKQQVKQLTCLSLGEKIDFSCPLLAPSCSLSGQDALISHLQSCCVPFKDVEFCQGGKWSNKQLPFLVDPVFELKSRLLWTVGWNLHSGRTIVVSCNLP